MPKKVKELLARLGVPSDATSVDLSQKGLTLRDIEVLVGCPAVGLQSLRLCYNFSIGDAGTALIAASLERHLGLTSLDLGFDSIGEDASVHVLHLLLPR